MDKFQSAHEDRINKELADETLRRLAPDAVGAEHSPEVRRILTMCEFETIAAMDRVNELIPVPLREEIADLMEESDEAEE